MIATASSRSKSSKPKKPYPTFPLTPHANGQWCKKIRRKVHFFGVWADPKAALEKYNLQAGDLHAGRLPRATNADAVTVKQLANAYLGSQHERVNAVFS